MNETYGTFLMPRTYIELDFDLQDNMLKSMSSEVSLKLGEIVYSKKYKDFSIFLTRDGLVIIELNDGVLKELERINPKIPKNEYKLIFYSSEYKNYINLVYMIFKLAFCYNNKEIQLHDFNDSLITMDKNNDSWIEKSIKGSGYGNVNSYNNFWFTNRRNLDTLKFYDFTFIKLNNDEFKKIIASFENLMDIVEGDENLSQILLVIGKAYLNYINGQFEIALILFWTVIEKIIYLMWYNTLEQKKLLSIKDDKNYTASVISNSLYITGIIDKKLLDLINLIRKDRNIIVHGDYNMFAENKIGNNIFDIVPKVGKSIECVQILMKQKYSIDINISNMMNI